jgi:hypothetical protein
MGLLVSLILAKELFTLAQPRLPLLRKAPIAMIDHLCTGGASYRDNTNATRRKPSRPRRFFAQACLLFERDTQDECVFDGGGVVARPAACYLKFVPLVKSKRCKIRDADFEKRVPRGKCAAAS